MTAPAGEPPDPASKDPDAEGGAALREAARLFDSRQYFEAHDVLEDEWAGARGVRRAGLQALVKIAAGMHHLATSSFPGAASLLGSGLAGLAEVERAGLPVNVPALRAASSRCLRKARASVAGETVRWEPEDVPRLVLTLPDPGSPDSPDRPRVGFPDDSRRGGREREGPVDT